MSAAWAFRSPEPALFEMTVAFRVYGQRTDCRAHVTTRIRKKLLRSWEEDAMSLVDAANNWDALVDADGLHRFLDFRPRIQQHHPGAMALQRPGTRYEHAHAERRDELERG